MFWIFSCFALVASTLGRDLKPELPIENVVEVFNGEDSLSAWPWQVSIQKPNGGHFCGGTLINKNWILTAAHCPVQTGYLVVLGEYDRGSDDEAVQIRKIVEVIKHPRFNKRTFNNDAALLRLSSPVELTSRVSPVKLISSSTNVPAGTLCVTTGWGRTATGQGPRILQETTLPIVSTARCRLYWGLTRFITDSMICAGGSGSSACQGDSGGPLLCDSKGVWYQVGIVSWGTPECNVNAPGVFSRVSSLRQWIDETVSSN